MAVQLCHHQSQRTVLVRKSIEYLRCYVSINWLLNMVQRLIALIPPMKSGSVVAATNNSSLMKSAMKHFIAPQMQWQRDRRAVP